MPGDSRRFGLRSQLLGGSPGGGGSGVTGPGVSTDNAVARYDGVSGTFIQNSLVTIDDSGELTATVVHTGDLVMSDKDRDARWRLIERHGDIIAFNEVTGLLSRLKMEPVSFEEAQDIAHIIEAVQKEDEP